MVDGRKSGKFGEKLRYELSAYLSLLSAANGLSLSSERMSRTFYVKRAVELMKAETNGKNGRNETYAELKRYDLEDD